MRKFQPDKTGPHLKGCLVSMGHALQNSSISTFPDFKQRILQLCLELKLEKITAKKFCKSEIQTQQTSFFLSLASQHIPCHLHLDPLHSLYVDVSGGSHDSHSHSILLFLPNPALTQYSQIPQAAPSPHTLYPPPYLPNPNTFKHSIYDFHYLHTSYYIIQLLIFLTSRLHVSLSQSCTLYNLNNSWHLLTLSISLLNGTQSQPQGPNPFLHLPELTKKDFLVSYTRAENSYYFKANR